MAKGSYLLEGGQFEFVLQSGFTRNIVLAVACVSIAIPSHTHTHTLRYTEHRGLLRGEQLIMAQMEWQTHGNHVFNTIPLQSLT